MLLKLIKLGLIRWRIDAIRTQLGHLVNLRDLYNEEANRLLVIEAATWSVRVAQQARAERATIDRRFVEVGAQIKELQAKAASLNVQYSAVRAS